MRFQYKVDFGHTPVLLPEVISLLPESAKVLVDLTIGGAGHAAELLRQNSTAFLWGIDQDSDALKQAEKRLAEFSGRYRLIHDRFAHAVPLLIQQGIKADFVLADLGVSSYQLEEPERGFSFRQDGPLDMRMDQNRSLTAATIVNEWSEPELTALIRNHGEEDFALRIARAIVNRRKRRPFATTGDLAACIQDALPARRQHGRIHPATKTFQAIRIEINDGLNELRRFLERALEFLNDQGRLVMIAFHSLEDRPIKEAFRHWVDPCDCPKNLPRCICGRKPVARFLPEKRLMASEQEIGLNPRSRSARLRTIEKL